MNVYTEIHAERFRQDAKYGGPGHDDEHTPEDWLTFIRTRGLSAENHMRGGRADEYRRRLIQIAALAVAAAESWDRREQEAQETQRNDARWAYEREEQREADQKLAEMKDGDRPGRVR